MSEHNSTVQSGVTMPHRPTRQSRLASPVAVPASLLTLLDLCSSRARFWQQVRRARAEALEQVQAEADALKDPSARRRAALMATKAAKSGRL